LLLKITKEKKKERERKRSVRVVGLPHVNQRQHHEDEGLQRDHHDVENAPHGSGDHMPDT
jgi:hypothetical protein